MSESIEQSTDMMNTTRERIAELQRRRLQQVARNYTNGLESAYATALRRPDDTCPLFGLVREYRVADWGHAAGPIARMTCVAHNSRCVQLEREEEFPTMTQAADCAIMQYVRENT